MLQQNARRNAELQREAKLSWPTVIIDRSESMDQAPPAPAPPPQPPAPGPQSAVTPSALNPIVNPNPQDLALAQILAQRQRRVG